MPDRQDRDRDDRARQKPRCTARLAAAAQQPEASPYRVPAVEKALDVLEYMAAAAEGRTQTEIAAGVGRSIHEVYRIIQLLERRGYIARQEISDRYVLTFRLFTMVHRFPPLANLTTAAAAPMRWLAETARQSCHLAILAGREVIVVAQVNSPQPMFYAVTLGARFPVEETSSGLVLLAGLPEEPRTRVLDDIARHGGGRRAGNELIEHLRPVLRDGFDVRPSLMVPGVVNVSFPVHGHLGTVVAALTTPYLPVSHDSPPLDPVQAATAVAAARISAALGFSGAQDRAA